MKILGKETSSENGVFTDRLINKIVTLQENLMTFEQLVGNQNDELKGRLSELETSISSVVNELQDKEVPIQRIAADLASLIDSLASTFSTDSLMSNSFLSQHAEIEEVHADKIYSNTGEFLEISSEKIEAQRGIFNSIVVQTFEISNLVMKLLSVGEITADSIASTSAIITELEATKAEISRLLVKRISNTEWKTPTGTPDNTHLLRVRIPAFSGTYTITTEQDEFSITVSQNNLVSFTQRKNYLFRIDWDAQTNDTLLYFANMGDSFSYAILALGADREIEAASNLVLRSSYEQNIFVDSGTGIYMRTEPITSGAEKGLSVVVVDTLPVTGIQNTIYITNDGAFYWDESLFKFIPLYPDVVIEEEQLPTEFGNKIYIIPNYEETYIEVQ